MDPDRTEQLQGEPATPDSVSPAVLRQSRQRGTSGALLLFIFFLAIAAVLVVVNELRSIVARG